MVHQNYQNLIEMTSNIIYIVAFGVGSKCPHKIHLNTQWGGESMTFCPRILNVNIDEGFEGNHIREDLGELLYWSFNVKRGKSPFIE